MPRVLLRVKSLAAFPALIVYLHTKNQAELFRVLIPQWICDVLHPLPLASALARTLPSSGGPAGRSVEAVVHELVLQAKDDELAHVCMTVASLKENLEEIGLHEEALSNEVEMTYAILLKAVNRIAQASADDIS